MKLIQFLSWIAVMAFVFTACSGSKKSVDASPTAIVQSTPTPTPMAKDESQIDSSVKEFSTIVLDRTVRDRKSGSKTENILMNSGSLNIGMYMNVYLPKGYDEKNEYPVLYLLPGYGTSEAAWFSYGICDKADALIESGQIKPLIMVTPQTNNSFNINSGLESTSVDELAKGMYEDYLYKDVVELVDSTYSTIKSRDGRYIGGASMGGYGALNIGFRHTDMFSRIGGHHPYIATKTNYPGFMDALGVDQKTREGYDTLKLAADTDLKDVHVYLDCGQEDELRFGALELYEVLKKEGVDVEHHESPGQHNGDYLTSNLEKYLLFYAGK